MTVTPATIVEALRTSPGWVRVGLTAPRHDLRYDAYKALSEHVFRTLFPHANEAHHDRDQMTLPL